jgi:hypothetical protein
VRPRQEDGETASASIVTNGDVGEFYRSGT